MTGHFSFVYIHMVLGIDKGHQLSVNGLLMRFLHTIFFYYED